MRMVRIGKDGSEYINVQLLQCRWSFQILVDSSIAVVANSFLQNVGSVQIFGDVDQVGNPSSSHLQFVVEIELWSVRFNEGFATSAITSGRCVVMRNSHTLCFASLRMPFLKVLANVEVVENERGLQDDSGFHEIKVIRKLQL